MYSLIVTRRADKGLRRLAADVRRRVTTALRGLAMDPRPPGCRQVVMTPGLWRIRVGDYRIGYTIDDDARIVRIERIDHRSAFYE